MSASDMQETEWYRGWFNHPYYHLLYEDRDEQEAADFIDRLIVHLQPPAGSSMLDIACGKGRHSIRLAEKDFIVTGIDISPQSIREAQLSGTANLEFFVHDMRLPFRINYYDYAFNFFTSFGYFDSLKEHQGALHNMALSLKPGGVFVMDYLNPSFTEQHLQPTSEIHKNNIQFNISRWSDKNYIYKKIRIEDAASSVPITFMEKVAYFNLQDFTNMFHREGLSIHEVFGDYHLRPFDPSHSARMIMIARKHIH
jgi:SAM-dependent methyltransferase